MKKTTIIFTIYNMSVSKSKEAKPWAWQFVFELVWITPALEQTDLQVFTSLTSHGYCLQEIQLPLEMHLIILTQVMRSTNNLINNLFDKSTCIFVSVLCIKIQLVFVSEKKREYLKSRDLHHLKKSPDPDVYVEINLVNQTDLFSTL